MKEIKKLVTELSGHRGRECYYILCLAVYVVLIAQPVEPQMKQVWAEVKVRAGKKSPKTVSKAISRAVSDIWENGERTSCANSSAVPWRKSRSLGTWFWSWPSMCGASIRTCNKKNGIAPLTSSSFL